MLATGQIDFLLDPKTPERRNKKVQSVTLTHSPVHATAWALVKKSVLKIYYLYSDSRDVTLHTVFFWSCD